MLSTAVVRIGAKAIRLTNDIYNRLEMQVKLNRMKDRTGDADSIEVQVQEGKSRCPDKRKES